MRSLNRVTFKYGTDFDWTKEERCMCSSNEGTSFWFCNEFNGEATYVEYGSWDGKTALQSRTVKPSRMIKTL